MFYIRKVLRLPFLLAFTALLFLSACADPELEKADVGLKQAEAAIGDLETILTKSERGSGASLLPNLAYLQQYAATMRRINPDMGQLISTLEAEGTVKGGSFQFLKTRLANAKKIFETQADSSREAAITVATEAEAITRAAQPDVFNDSLVDVINVLADMSKGELPKLKFGETTDKSMPPTQHLVGNPRYGSWGGSGGNLWVWYGQYRLFSDVLGWGSGYRYNRDSWYRSRSGSYYGDVGRYYYGSNRTNAVWSRTAQKQPKVALNKASPSTVRSFKSTKRLSTYAPRATGAPKSMAKAYKAKNTSSYAKTSRFSKSRYANIRSSPRRSGGFGRRSGGK